MSIASTTGPATRASRVERLLLVAGACLAMGLAQAVVLAVSPFGDEPLAIAAALGAVALVLIDARTRTMGVLPWAGFLGSGVPLLEALRDPGGSLTLAVSGLALWMSLELLAIARVVARHGRTTPVADRLGESGLLAVIGGVAGSAVAVVGVFDPVGGLFVVVLAVGAVLVYRVLARSITAR